jgi:hypothetical protein
MDTSEIYIKMCDCAEIQDLRSDIGGDDEKFFCPTDGDLVYDKDNDWSFIICGARHCNWSVGYYENADIWLPRQDQLQEMVDDTDDRKLSLIEKWTDQTYIDHWKPWGIFKSFEQLWLAFVMSEKFGLIWNGTEWVTNNISKHP